MVTTLSFAEASAGQTISNEALQRRSQLNPFNKSMDFPSHLVPGPNQKSTTIPWSTSALPDQPGGWAYRQIKTMDAEESWQGGERMYWIKMRPAIGYSFCSYFYKDRSGNPLQDPIDREANYVGMRLTQSKEDYLESQFWIKPSGTTGDQQRSWIRGTIDVIWIHDDAPEDRRFVCEDLPKQQVKAEPFKQSPTPVTIVQPSPLQERFHWVVNAHCEWGGFHQIRIGSIQSCADAEARATIVAWDECRRKVSNDVTIRLEVLATTTCR